ncbi:hypothetical protein Tco_1133146 [Tanacetum coccineum]|uniref:Uncharacterized protein n=1 Tax=Tanacetum coccineum TaxID=301880 RepID=A0ABQ5JFE9_9ASTR
MPLRDPNIYVRYPYCMGFGLKRQDDMVPQKGRPKLGAPPPPPPPPSQHHHHRCHHQMTHYHNCLIRRQDFGSMILIRVSLSSSGSESAM